MRRLSLLALALLLFVSLAGPARADDEAISRLENRVEMLLDLVAELRKEVVDLRHRVTELEVTLAQSPPKSTPAAVVLTAEIERGMEADVPEVVEPAEPKAVVSEDGITSEEFPKGVTWVPTPDHAAIGVYVIDRKASLEAILERTLQAASSPEEEAAMREMAEETFKNIDMRIELKADGTFAASVSGMGGEPRTAGGAWIQKDETITLITTIEDGVEKDTPDDEIQGIWKDGIFTLSEDGDEFVVVFVQQK
jgi:hypothetical protein